MKDNTRELLAALVHAEWPGAAEVNGMPISDEAKEAQVIALATACARWSGVASKAIAAKGTGK